MIFVGVFFGQYLILLYSNFTLISNNYYFIPWQPKTLTQTRWTCLMTQISTIFLTRTVWMALVMGKWRYPWEQTVFWCHSWNLPHPILLQGIPSQSHRSPRTEDYRRSVARKGLAVQQRLKDPGWRVQDLSQKWFWKIWKWELMRLMLDQAPRMAMGRCVDARLYFPWNAVATCT